MQGKKTVIFKDKTGKIYPSQREAAGANLFISIKSVPASKHYVEGVLVKKAKAHGATGMAEKLEADVLQLIEELVLTHWIECNLTDLENLIAGYLDDIRTGELLKPEKKLI